MLYPIYGATSERLPTGPCKHIPKFSASLLAKSEPRASSIASPWFQYHT